MKKGIIVNLKHFRLLNYVTQNKILILLSVGFIAGILLGTVMLNRNTWLPHISETFFYDLISIHNSKTFIKKFFSCFFRYFILYVFYFLSGASMLGVAITPFITVWQGIIIGNITSFIYTKYGLSGIAFNAIILILPLAIFVVSCFFAAKNAIDFSLSIAKLTLPRSRPISLSLEFKDYCIKYLIFLAIAVVCTLIEIILNSLFLKFFNFF